MQRLYGLIEIPVQVLAGLDTNSMGARTLGLLRLGTIKELRMSLIDVANKLGISV